jgi:tRNA dimethylallyltransferase
MEGLPSFACHWRNWKNILSVAERKIVVLGGPTASGKTELALRLADALPLSLVSADSMQVYRGMDIGTSKPSVALRRRFALVDVADPGEGYSAGRFAREAASACERAWSEGLVPMVVGGSGLYIRALLNGLADLPPVPLAVRRSVESMPADARVAELRRLDAESLTGLDLDNPRRVGRALEILISTGKGLKAWQRDSHVRSLDYGPSLGFWLDPEPSVLAARIHARNEAALAAGWLDEARGLAARYGREALVGTGAIGYAELLDMEPADAAPRIEIRTRQYARRQRTWFRKEACLSRENNGEAILRAATEFIRG